MNFNFRTQQIRRLGHYIQQDLYIDIVDFCDFITILNCLQKISLLVILMFSCLENYRLFNPQNCGLWKEVRCESVENANVEHLRRQSALGRSDLTLEGFVCHHQRKNNNSLRYLQFAFGDRQFCLFTYFTLSPPVVNHCQCLAKQCGWTGEYIRSVWWWKVNQ